MWGSIVLCDHAVALAVEDEQRSDRVEREVGLEYKSARAWRCIRHAVRTMMGRLWLGGGRGKEVVVEIETMRRWWWWLE